MGKILAAMTLFLMSCTGASPVYANELTQLDALAQNIYFEQRTELANDTITDIDAAQVGYVVMNRVASKHFPNSIIEVVYQYKQFSWTHDGKSDVMANWHAQVRAYRIAAAVIFNMIPNEIGDADHYLNKRISKATWYINMDYRGDHSNHTFYKR